MIHGETKHFAEYYFDKKNDVAAIKHVYVGTSEVNSN